MPHKISIPPFNWRAFFLLLLSLGLYFIPCSTSAAGPYIRSKPAYGRTYLYISDIAKYYGMTISTGGDICEIRNSRWKIKFNFDKREASINGFKINFLFPAVNINSTPLVSSQDFYMVIDPVLRAFSVPKQTVKTIVIDAGHGGDDKGASGKKFDEKNITLKVAQKLKGILSEQGFNVYMTRSKDNTLSLDQRTSKCIAVGADIFVSIHCNATKNKAITGIETFCLTPEGAPSTSDSKPKSTKHKGNSFNKNNYLLAHTIHSRLIPMTGAGDRGIKHARFVVLKDVACPAVLVEMGFISNSYEENKIGQNDYQDKVARAIADGISRYYKLLSGKK